MRLLPSVAAVVLACPLVAAGLGASAHAAPGPILTETDTWHDVRIHQRAEGLSRPARQSIDIRRFTVTDVGAKVRFAVRWREVVQTERFDQMVFVSLKPPRASDETWSGQVGFSPQAARYGYASLIADDTYEDVVNCDPTRSRSRAATQTVWIDVPKRCVPTGPARITVSTLTGGFRGDGEVWSSDRLTVPGVHELR